MSKNKNTNDDLPHINDELSDIGDDSLKMADESSNTEEHLNKNHNKNTTPQIDQKFSDVATDPKQSILIIIIIAILFLYLLYNLFADTDDDQNTSEDVVQLDRKKIITPNADHADHADDTIPLIPTLPAVPKIDEPTPPPPPPIAPPAPPPPPLDPLPNQIIQPELPLSSNDLLKYKEESIALPNIEIHEKEKADKRKDAKRKSNILIISNAGAVNGTTLNNSNIEAEKSDFHFRGDTSLILGRGKIIDAIIETPINTDFGGEIRAIINRDVYSESGKVRLISKGSRIFGNYSTGIDGAYGRVSILWHRIDLSNGYSLNFAGAGIDALGRNGNQGRVDDKFKERMTNAVLTSALNIAIANGLDCLVKPQINSQQAAHNSTLASNIKATANGIANQADASITPNQKRLSICSSVQLAITDKTSTAFTQIKSACDNLNADTNSNEQGKLVAIINAVNTASDTLLQNTNNNVEETKAQAASKAAFTNLSQNLTKIIDSPDLNPTITLNQGAHIKIYVTKDYIFPKKVLTK